MSVEVTSQPPPASAGLAAAGEDAAVGGLCRVLAASRPGGVFLALGRGAGALGAWIQDGMDLSSRLVILADADEAADLRPVFADDLRVTVHPQDADGFLADVRGHRFDLIADPGADAAAPAALTGLAPGGFYLAGYPIAELEAMLATAGARGDGDVRSMVCTRLAGEPGLTLVTYGPRRIEAKRRGGRRARKSVTPLFPSRGR